MGYLDTPVTQADGLSGYQRAVQLFRMIEKRRDDTTAQYRELAKITALMPDDVFQRYIATTEIERQKESR